jgi:DNA recombination protein RmuC
VDSKVSLVDYLEATSTEDEAERQKYLQKNVQSLKNHIDELSDKEYQKLLKNTSLNYVIMFIPVESAYIAALDYDRYLYDYAYKKNVILATPLSLLPTLRTVENLWRMSDQNQNVQKIAELGGKIYDKLAAFVDDMKGLERGMHAANNAYNAAMTKLAGRGGALPQAEKMKSLGAVTNKNINLDLSDTGLLLENNVETTAEGADND